MAYTALTSLKQTIERLVNSSRISIFPPSPEIKSAYEMVKSKRDYLEMFQIKSESLNDLLDGQIREAVCKIEDVLEYHVANQFVSQSERIGEMTVDLQELNQELDSFTQSLESIWKEYTKHDFIGGTPPPLDSSQVYFGVKKKSSEMVGLSDQYQKIRDNLAHKDWSASLKIVSLVGMAGIGKTTLAREIFEDPFIVSYFDCRVWISVCPEYQLKEILQCILAQVNPDVNISVPEGDDEESHQNSYQSLKRLVDLKAMMYESLKGRRYLVVLDDVWSTKVWDDLERLLPITNNGSRALLTTRLHKVAESAATSLDTYDIRFLNKDESWDLLCQGVFGEEMCPFELEKAGKKIAENCDGLPLTIVTIAGLLSRVDWKPERWNQVAYEKENLVFMDAYDKMSKVLFTSYKYLARNLQTCFLYMGVFPEKCEISLSKLIKLWSAEGFLELDLYRIGEGFLKPDRYSTKEDFLVKCLEEIVSQNLVMTRQKSFNDRIKTCALHSVFWHLCIKEARKNSFFHLIDKYSNCIQEKVESQRRLSIHNNMLFGISDVFASVASNGIIRSLLFTNQYHQFSVPIYDDWRLLRVLDALTIRFYEFPMEVLRLVQLRYFALTYDGNLPPSISKLWNLQCLVVRRHLSISFSATPLDLPIEIWDLKELKHLQLMGSTLPDLCGALLPNLLTLSGISAYSCINGVLKRIPNLKKLGIRIELAPDTVEPFQCFDHISHLHGLESLKCVVVNPELISQIVAPPAPLSIFTSGLKKLTLSGSGYPWEYMRAIASLPNLEVLKLRCYAFQGPKWETNGGGFWQLKYLLIEDTDLVHWTAEHGSFRLLKRVIIKHCYKLEKIPQQFGPVFPNIELVDCNPSVVNCVNQIKEDQSKVYADVSASWNEGNSNHKLAIGVIQVS